MICHPCFPDQVQGAAIVIGLRPVEVNFCVARIECDSLVMILDCEIKQTLVFVGGDQLR